MLIFGHKLIASKIFKSIANEKDLNTNQINCFSYDENFIELCLRQDFDFAIKVKNENEVILANALKANFILCDDENLASKASKIAEFYLFDSKVLLIMPNLNELEKAYKLGLDGIILQDFIL